MPTMAELKALREKAWEQLSADYACYFSKEDAMTMIILADAEIERQTRPTFTSEWHGKDGAKLQA